MKKRFIYFTFLFVGLLSACMANVSEMPTPTKEMVDALETPTLAEAKIWQSAYIDLLGGYEGESSQLFFLLHDLDGDSIPELIVAGMYDDEVYDAVFTFRDESVLSLDYGEDVPIADFILSARSGIMPSPDNSQGLINYVIGPSAGAFGTSWYYTKVVIEKNRLIVSDRGMSYIDVETLNGLFDNFGRDTTDYEALNTAIGKHTHYYINDDFVSMDELYLMFGDAYENDEVRRLAPLSITESNIRDAVFGWLS